MARHRGHPINAATRKKISDALKRRNHGGKHRAKRESLGTKATKLNGRLEARMINEKYKADTKAAQKKKRKAQRSAERKGRASTKQRARKQRIAARAVGRKRTVKKARTAVSRR